MVAVPTATAVTVPSALTVAISGLLLLQTTEEFETALPSTITINCGAVSAPISTDSVESLNVTSTVGAYFPFCYAYEGHHAPPGHFSRTVRSTFGGNLLCWSYEHYPESALTKALVRHYGERPALEHLFWSFDNMRRLEGIREFYAARGIRDFNRYYLFRMTDGELRLWIRFARERGGVEKASKP